MLWFDGRLVQLTGILDKFLDYGTEWHKHHAEYNTIPQYRRLGKHFFAYRRYRHAAVKEDAAI